MSTLQMICRCRETEFLKLISQKKYRVMLIIVAIFPIAFALIHSIPNSYIRFSMDKFPYTLLSVASYFLLPLTAFMMASDIYAGEQERGELKIILTKPVTRIAASLGKVLAMITYHGLILTLLFIISSAISILNSGFGATNLFLTLIAYVLTLLPALTVCSMAAMISSMSHTSTSSFSINLLSYMGILILGLIFSGASPALFTTYTSIFKMVIGSSIPFSQFLLGIGILVGYTMIFLSAMTMAFDNKEI